MRTRSLSVSSFPSLCRIVRDLLLLRGLRNRRKPVFFKPPNPGAGMGPQGEVFVPEVGKPVTGYRFWRVEYRHGLWVLASTWIPIHWPYRRRLTAHCMARPVAAGGYVSARRLFSAMHESPAPRLPTHECGIYACCDIEHALNVWGHMAKDAPLWADGEISMWGKVIPHEKGWRAQYAYPKTIVLHSKDEWADAAPKVLDELAAAYGVPAVLHSSGCTLCTIVYRKTV